MANDAAMAVGTGWSHQMDRALEAIECARTFPLRDGKSLIAIISTSVTNCHDAPSFLTSNDLHVIMFAV